QAEPDEIPISIEANRQLFWMVMRDIAAQTKSSPGASGTISSIILSSDENWAKYPAVASGPAVFTADQIHHDQTIHASGENPSSQFYLGFTAYLDPRLRLLRPSGDVSIKEAQDDRGNALAQVQPEVEEDESDDPGHFDAPWQVPLEVFLEYPKQPGKHIARLRGSASFWIQTRSRKWEIPDAQKATAIAESVGGRRHLFNGISPLGEDYRVDLTIQQDKSTPAEWRWYSQIDWGQTLRLYDAQGRA